jgi:uncharacterized lipoprotein YbaY
VQHQLKALGANVDLRQKIALSVEATQIKIALRDPSLAEAPEKGTKSEKTA